MTVIHYRLPAVLAASLSLALAACASTAPTPGPQVAGKAKDSAQLFVQKEPNEIDTDATIWTVLGMAKEQRYREPGPQTGSTVSPILWQAALDTLSFVKFASQDPLGGSLVTDWYSPKGNPNVRYRITVFVLSRSLASDSVAVTVDRQELSPTGQWVATTIARKVEDDLETKILYRARQLKRAWMAQVNAS
ncbi:MAG TPA: DUF3576 domain-containing protein [Stellaceae bacterium]|jgi:hypothetical protein|nr:DUF3576 domain-containing protein [Stellaceae bacterium]